VAELKYADDMHMHNKHDVTHDHNKHKYAPLIQALCDAGREVPHETASIVIGHRSTALHRNKKAFTTPGIVGKKQQHVLNSLTDISVRYTQMVVNITRRVRARRG
jgi:hypothetical protein